MAKLGPKQRKKLQKIRRTQGKEAAREFRQRVLDRKATAAAAPTPTTPPPAQIAPNAAERLPVDINDVNNVLAAQESANQEATRGSTPNVNTIGGSRQVTYDENGQPTVTETLSPEQKGLYDQRIQVLGSVNDQFQTFGRQVGEQGQFNPQANNPFAMNEDFRAMQDRVYQDTLARYERDSEGQIAQQKEALAQSLADKGIPLGSKRYRREMNRFEDNVRQSREDVRSRAFQDSIGAASTGFQNNLAGNQQAFGQNLTAYQLPFQRYQAMAGMAGQYDRPNLGAVQSIQNRPVDYTGVATAYRGQNIQNDQFGQKMGQDASQFDRSMDQQMQIARMNNATSRSNAGAGRTDPFALLAAQTAAKKELMGYEAGLNAGRMPQRPQTSWGDVAGQVVGGLASGFAQGMV